MTWLAIKTFIKGALFGGPKIPIPIGMLVLFTVLISAYWNVSWAAKAREQVRQAIAEVVADIELTALRTELEAEKLRAVDLQKTIETKDSLIAINQRTLEEFRARAAENAATVQERDDEIDELLRNRPTTVDGQACECGPPDGLTNRLRDQ